MSAVIGGLLGAVSSSGSSTGVTELIVALAAGCFTAFAGLIGVYLKLKTLGSAERGELEAKTYNIIQTAEDRATARALEALRLALEATERERDRLRTRVEVLESDSIERARELSSAQAVAALVKSMQVTVGDYKDQVERLRAENDSLRIQPRRAG